MKMIGTYLAVNPRLLNDIFVGTAEVDDVDAAECPMLGLGRTWQAIHRTICGTEDNGVLPRGYVIPLLDPHEVECDPDLHVRPYYLAAPQIKTAYACIKDMSEEAFRMAYEAEGQDMDCFFDVWDRFEALRTFYAQVIDMGRALIFYIS